MAEDVPEVQVYAVSPKALGLQANGRWGFVQEILLILKQLRDLWLTHFE